MPVDLEIVSPEKLLLSRPVDMVVIPAAEGERRMAAAEAEYAAADKMDVPALDAAMDRIQAARAMVEAAQAA